MRSLFLFLLPSQVSHEPRKYVPHLGQSSFDCHCLRLFTISGRQLVGARRKSGMRSVFFPRPRSISLPLCNTGSARVAKREMTGLTHTITVGKNAHLSGLPLKAQQLLACEQSFSTSKRDSGSVIVPSSSSFACSPGATSDDNILSALAMEPASPQAWSW